MKRLLYVCVALVTLCLLGLLVGAVNEVAAFASRFHPAVGSGVFWMLLAAVGAGILYLAFSYSRMSRSLLALEPNSSASEIDAYRRELRLRLATNPRLSGVSVATDDEVELALEKLSTEADAVIRQTASTVFITTALMQNGRLDGLVVLFTQFRMTWRVAAIYVQRPSLREMLHLYVNVATTAFVASSIQELDIGQMFAPLAATAVPALKAGIPGLHGISALLVRCVSNGTANAFLTLRVGEVARRYCALTSPASAEQIRIGATAAAVSHLRRIVAENGAIVAKQAWNATAGVLYENGVAKADDLLQGVRGVFDRFFKRTVLEDELAAK